MCVFCWCQISWSVSRTLSLRGVQNRTCTYVSWGFCRGIAEDPILLGYDSESASNWIPLFQGNIVSSYSGFRMLKKQWFWDLIIHWHSIMTQRNRILMCGCIQFCQLCCCVLVSVHTVHWPMVPICLGVAILQTTEHLTYSCSLLGSCHSSGSWTFMNVLSLIWSCSLFRLCHSSARWTLSSTVKPQVQDWVTVFEVGGGQSGHGGSFCPSFLDFPFLIVVLLLLHTCISLPPEMYRGRNRAARCYNFEHGRLCHWLSTWLDTSAGKFIVVSYNHLYLCHVLVNCSVKYFTPVTCFKAQQPFDFKQWN